MYNFSTFAIIFYNDVKRIYFITQGGFLMITCEDIRYFFETYYDNFITSVSWEDRLLEPANRDEWLKKLRACADEQQRICAENQNLLETYLYRFKDDSASLSAECYDMILSFCRKLYYSRYTEPALLLYIIDILLPHYLQTDDRESLLFLYICGGYANMELSRTGDKNAGQTSCAFYEKAITYRDFIDTFELSSSREYIFVAYYNLIRVAPALGNLSLESAFRFLEELCHLRAQEKFCKYDEENPRIPYLANKAIDDFRAYGNVLSVEYHDAPEHITAALKEMTRIRYQEQLATVHSIYQCSPFIVFNYHRILAEEGTISWDTAWNVLDDFYHVREKTIREEPDQDLLAFYCNLPLNLIDILKKTSFPEDFKHPYYKKYREHVINYLTNQPVGLNAYTLNNGLQIACFHPLMLGTFDNRSEKLNFIFDLIVSKHLSTLTHSVMVSYLAEAIAKRLITEIPEVLYVPASGLSLETFIAHQADTLDFIVRSALFHDLGKNGLIPIINTQHRRLNDYEFQIIRTHPEKGAEYLMTDPDFSMYQEIALGHHKSYDGKHGYPATFDNVNSMYRPAIDLIHICDCLDAATDYLSRNYHRAKSFDTVMEELRAGSGTEYNPDIVNFILNDRNLYQELKHLTEENRENIYYDIYLTFIDKRKQK